jgi:hypothetical protein
VLSIAYQISDEAVTSLKADLKVEEDAEEIGFGSEAVRLVCHFQIHDQHHRLNPTGLLWS